MLRSFVIRSFHKDGTQIGTDDGEMLYSSHYKHLSDMY